jgi:hypothetical protein
MKRTDIINYLIGLKGYKRYLEIGVQYPNSNYDLIKAEQKVGVEPYPVGDWETKGIIKTTSNEFFKELKSDEVFDIVFIDGLHERNQCLKDILNSLNHLSENGCILVHDCLPTAEYQTSLEDNNREWTGNVWKSIIDIKKKNGLEVYTIDTDWGIGFIRTNSEFIATNWIGDLSWNEYEHYKTELLNIKSIEEWIKLV